MGLFNIFHHESADKPFSILDIDMHCHLLPGVDDGCKHPDETVECLQLLASLGFRRVILTPHFQSRYPNQEDDIERRYKDLKAVLKQRNLKDIPELVWVSGEYRFDDSFCRRPGEDRVIPLPGKRLLCELALHASDTQFFPTFKEYQKLGYTIILAHPERYPYLSVHMPEVAELVQTGAMLQINTLSLDGFYGDSARRKGWEYIEKGWVSYLGTDMHNMRYGEGLRRAAANPQILKMLKEYKFLNSSLLS